jgi:hypothetical protein
MSFLVWTRLQVVVAAVVLSTVTATAEYPGQVYYVAPAPSGSDENDCLSPSTPCATFQRAVNLCPVGVYCSIVPAPGIYSQKTNVYYYKVILISGPPDKDGNCSDRSAVVVDDRINGVGQPGAIFGVQDHAILAIYCMTLTSYANGSVGFSSRQFAIGDVSYIDFGQFRGATAISANETSKINVFSPGIHGDATRFAMASNLSQILINGMIRIGDVLTFEVAFLSALFNSNVLVKVSQIVGGEDMSGASYQCIDATISTNVTLPGRDVPYLGNENCRFNGNTQLNSELKSIRSEIDEKLSPEIKSIRSEIDEKLSPEIKAIRSEIEGKLGPEIDALYKILRNFVIGVLSALTVAAIVSAFYVWQRHRRRRVQTAPRR